MRNFLINSLLISAYLIFASSAHAEEPSKDVCIDSRPIAIGFFNGVKNTRMQAYDNLNAIKPIYSGKEITSPPHIYELFYNHTSGLTRDLLETFAQKYAEADLIDDGQLSYLEIFWYMYQMKGFEGLTEPENDLEKNIMEIISSSTDLVDFINKTNPIMQLNIAEYMKKLMTDEYNTVTQTDYTKHSAKLSHLIAQNYKLILVAHSQGNLFVNHAYETVAMGAKAKYPNMHHYVKIVHVAPASKVLYGPYVLSIMDKVIGALSVFFPVPEANIYATGSDSSNHGFQETYLKGYARTQIIRMLMQSQIDMIKIYNNENFGFIIETINTGDGLLNLNINGPNREGCPPGETCLPGVIIPLGLYGERYTMGCSEYGGAPEGTYHVNTWEKCYSYSGSAEGLPVRTFSADLIVKNGQGKKIIDKTITLPMPPCRISTENAKPIPLFSVTIKSSKNTKPEADMDIKE